MQRGHKAKVLHYIEHNPNMRLYINDIAAAIGLEYQQVNTVVSAAIRSGELPGLERPMQGVICYSPQGAKVGRMLFEEIGRSKTGKILIQDEAGNIYVAEEI
jgi:hypothetical protein